MGIMLREWWYRDDTTNGGGDNVITIAASDSRWGPTGKPHHCEKEDKRWHPKLPLPRQMLEPRLGGVAAVRAMLLVRATPRTI
ncbi:hypothetical protein Syun_010077 [Stephania yunnanensis]|uniref:Uncharacterized protein n=1 Tax=Stephania yunnanensis TaxID=152371 RepID=A0AAP0KFS6_9MAGN